MKLQKMTDFVLEQDKKVKNGMSPYEFTMKVTDYAIFLQQPLTLGMFVPCDENGNVLEEPIDYEYYISDNEQYFQGDEIFCDQYLKAKENVLFKGFKKVICNSEIAVQKEGKSIICLSETKEMTIESLINYEIELTELALKQIGINDTSHTFK